MTIKKEDWGYNGMFYTPESLQDHVDKYLNAIPKEHQAAALVLAFGIINYYATKVEELKLCSCAEKGD